MFLKEPTLCLNVLKELWRIRGGAPRTWRLLLSAHLQAALSPFANEGGVGSCSIRRFAANTHRNGLRVLSLYSIYFSSGSSRSKKHNPQQAMKNQSRRL